MQIVGMRIGSQRFPFKRALDPGVNKEQSGFQ